MVEELEDFVELDVEPVVVVEPPDAPAPPEPVSSPQAAASVRAKPTVAQQREREACIVVLQESSYGMAKDEGTLLRNHVRL